jgi:hypothetical protein
MLKVLVVYSWDDGISQRRYEHLRRALREAPFQFEQCFALSSSEEMTRSDTISIRVSKAIDQYQPNVLLIHTGAAYQQDPQEYATAILAIHSKYSNLRLGLERRWAAPDLLDTKLFEESDEMQGIERAFFP